MSTFYKTPLRSDEIYHYGRSKRDGAPGPGSGRYPLGSGKNGKHLSFFKRYADDDIRKYQKDDGSLTRAGKKKQAKRDEDLANLQKGRREEVNRLNYYRSFKTASDDEVYRNVKRDIEYGDYTETGHYFTRAKKHIDEARNSYIRQIPRQEKTVKDLDVWIDKHQNTPLNKLTPLEQIRKRNREEWNEYLETTFGKKTKKKRR